MLWFDRVLCCDFVLCCDVIESCVVIWFCVLVVRLMIVGMRNGYTSLEAGMNIYLIYVSS